METGSGKPYDRIRSATARRLTFSATTKPQVTLHSSARSGRLQSLLPELATSGGGPLRLTHLLARVTAHALATNAALNGWVKDEVLTLSPTVHLAIAVQADHGLVAPVLAEVESLRFAEFVSRMNDLVGRARANRLHPRELAGATFTFSNLGSTRVRHFTPIVSPPQLAILGVGRGGPVPSWDGSGWQAVEEVPLSLTFDHAAIDGHPAARFLDHLIAHIEDPPGGLWR